MIVDTSALIAILREEPEAPEFARLIATADPVRISAVSYVEAGAVLDRADNPAASRQLDRLLQVAAIETEPVTVTQAAVARAAYRDFGKGSGHPAALNFGDCFSYALATETAEPLLFKGDGFGHTDIESAVT
jgi:ribonuclease VapC